MQFQLFFFLIGGKVNQKLDLDLILTKNRDSIF